MILAWRAVQRLISICKEAMKVIKHQWFSGKIQRCQRWAPSSILGWRRRMIYVLDFFLKSFVTFFYHIRNRQIIIYRTYWHSQDNDISLLISVGHSKKQSSAKSYPFWTFLAWPALANTSQRRHLPWPKIDLSCICYSQFARSVHTPAF